MKYRTLLVSIVASMAAMTIRGADGAQPAVAAASQYSIQSGASGDARTPQLAYNAAVFPLHYSAKVRNVVHENGAVREEIDLLLLVAVLGGLVITQLRRAQDRLQLPFGAD